MAIPVINNPCPEKWEGMSPAEEGRFCAKCCKVVVDFTRKTTQEILDFLSLHQGERICGKLFVQPVLIPAKRSKRTRLFSAALMVVFGSMLFTACGSPEEPHEVVGDIAIDSTTEANQRHYRDSVANADSMKADSATGAQESTNIDSAKMMEMMKLLDSVKAAKKP